MVELIREATNVHIRSAPNNGSRHFDSHWDASHGPHSSALPECANSAPIDLQAGATRRALSKCSFAP